MVSPVLPIVELAVTYSAEQPDQEEWILAGVIAGYAWLWFKRGEGDPITDVGLTHSLETPGPGFIRLESNLTAHPSRCVHLWYVKKNRQLADPMVDVRIGTINDGFIEAGMQYLPNLTVNPFMDTPSPKEYFFYKKRGESYRVGDLVDCLDSAHHWLPAKVIDEDSTRLHIHFEGWSNKWDEWIQRGSKRIAKYRSQSAPRTDKIIELERDVPSFNTCTTRLQTIYEILLEKDQQAKAQGVPSIETTHPAFQQVSPWQSKLTIVFPHLTTPLNELISELDLLFLTRQDNLRYIYYIMNAQIDEPILMSRAQQHITLNIYLLTYLLRTHGDLAIPYITDSLLRILGPIPSHLYNTHGIGSHDYTTLEHEKQQAIQQDKFLYAAISDPPEGLPSVYLIRHINTFGTAGGFDLMQYHLQTTAALSFTTISAFIRVLSSTRSITTPTFLNYFIPSLQLMTLMKSRVTAVTDDDLKTLDKRAFRDMTEHVVKLLQKAGNVTEAQLTHFSQTINLDIARRQLSANVLATKMDGMATLEACIKDSNRTEQQMMYQRNETVHITADAMATWLDENKVLENVLGRDSHEQIVKRSPTLLKFLATHNRLHVGHLDLLWTAANGKHEGLVRIVYDTIADLATCLNEEHLDAVYKQIQAKPFSEYKEFDLHFIRTFTINAIRARATRPATDEKWYGVDLLWKIIQSNDPSITPAISQLAASSLAQLLAAPEVKSQLLIYLDKCIGVLSPTSPISSVVPALKLAEIIISSQPEISTKLNIARAELINQLESEHKIIQAMMEDTIRYHKLASEMNTKQTGLTVDSIIGGHPHSVQIAQRLQFLAFILNQSTKLTLTQQNIDTLWNVYNTRPVFQEDKHKFYVWLIAAVDVKDKKDPLYLPLKLSKNIFQDLICSPNQMDYINLSIPGINLYESFFIYCNWQRECLLTSIRDMNKIVVVNYTKLKGMDALWSIATMNKNIQVQQQAQAFFITLHLRIDFLLSLKDKTLIIKAFIDKCMSQIGILLKTINTEMKKNNPKSTSTSTRTSQSFDSNYIQQITMLINFMDLFLTRITNNEYIGKPHFAVGQSVRATWKQQKAVYDARIARVNQDGTYFLQYNDGDRDEFTPERNIKAPEKKDDGSDREFREFARSSLANDKHFDILFELLGLGGDIAKATIDLLSKLPVNQALADNIRNLATSKSTPDWNVLLPASQSMKLIYTLRMIKTHVIMPNINPPVVPNNATPEMLAAIHRQHEVTNEPIRTGIQKWSEMFLTKGGFRHIYTILMNDTEELPIACASLLLEIIHAFLISSSSLSKVAHEQIDQRKLVPRLFQIMSTHVIQQQQRDADNSTSTAVVKVPTTPTNASLPPSPASRNTSIIPLAAIAPSTSTSTLPPPSPTQTTTTSATSSEGDLCGSIVQSTLAIINLCITTQPTLLDIVLNLSWDRVLISGILSKSSSVRIAMSNGLRILCQTSSKIQIWLLPRLLTCLYTMDTRQASTICTEYFDLLSGLLETKTNTTGTSGTEALTTSMASLRVDNTELSDPRLLLTTIGEKLRTHPILETSTHTSDPMLCGLLTLATSLFQQYTTYQSELGPTYIADVLLYLFQFPTTSSRHSGSAPPKCKSIRSREVAYQLLNTLAYHSHINTRQIVDYLIPMHYTTHNGGKRQDNWNFEPKYEEKAAQSGYIGIQNLGCICYMNAPLQQLFMIPALRDNLLNVDEYKSLDPKDPSSATDMRENLLYQVQHLFGLLQESEKSYCNPTGFCHAFKDLDGKPTDVRVQDDSGGFVQRLLDRLCMLLKGTQHEKAVSDVMGGVLSHELIGRGECCHYKDRDEEFYGMSVEVQNQKTLQDSLNAFIQGELLEGGNAFRCDKCNKKVDTLKRACIKKLPPTIFFTLKRFALNYETMETAKVNDRLEFPNLLDMYPYTKEGLAAIEKRKPAVVEDDGKSDDTEGDDKPAAEAEVVHPPEYYQYVLRGVVVHTGSAQGGHYYSFIQERESADSSASPRWFRFNDSVVTPFDPKDIADECFGGVEKRPTYSTNPKDGPDAMMEKYRNAYLLFYDRVLQEPPTTNTATSGAAKEEKQATAPVTPTAATASAATASGSSSGSSSTGSSSTNVIPKAEIAAATAAVAKPNTVSLAKSRMFEEIWRQNQNLWHDRAVFDIKYYEFLFRLISRVAETSIPATPTPAKSGPDLSLATLPTGADMPDLLATTQLALRFVLMTLARGRDKSMLQQWTSLCRRLLDASPESCAWFLHEFTIHEIGHEWILELMCSCPIQEVRKTMIELIGNALTNISTKEMETLVPGARQIFARASIVPTVMEPSTEGEVRLPVIHDQDHTAVPCTSYGINLIDHMLNYLNDIVLYAQCWDTYWGVLYRFITISWSHAHYVEREWHLLVRAIDLWFGRESLHPEVNNLPIDAHTNQRVSMPRNPDHNYFFRVTAILARTLTAPIALPYRPDAVHENPNINTLPLSPYGSQNPSPMPIDVVTQQMYYFTSQNDGFIIRLIRECEKRVRGQEIVLTFQHWCWESMAITKVVYEAIMVFFNAWDYDHIRPIIRGFVALCLIKDSIQQQRIDWLMTQILHHINKHMKFWKYTDFLIDHIIRLAKIEPLVFTYLHQHVDATQQLYDWYKTYPECPRHTHYSMHSHHSQSIMAYRNNLDNNYSPAARNFDVYNISVKKKLYYLDMIVQSKTLDTEDTADSDDDFSDRVLSVGDWVDCRDTSQKWLVAKVMQVHAETGKVLIHFDGWAEKWDEWLPASSPRIATGGSKVSKQDWENRGKPRAPAPATGAAAAAAGVKRVPTPTNNMSMDK